MISIVLNKIHLQIDDIATALETYDEKILTEMTCELLLPILPNKEEADEIEKTNTSYEELASTDVFIIVISPIVGNRLRINSLLFRLTYEEVYNILSEEEENYIYMLDLIKKDERLKKWLELILAHGNYLNGESSKGGAYGFKIELLGKLKETKSSNGKLNLVQYLVSYISDKLENKELLDIIDDYKLFDQLQYEALVESVKDYGKKFRNVENLKNLIDKTKKSDEKKDEGEKDLSENDATDEFLGTFYDKAKSYVEKLEKKIQEIDKGFEDIVKYFCDDPKKLTFNIFIDIFCKFRKAIDESYVWYLENKKKELSKAKKKK